MNESSKSKRGETREFWKEAVRLWAESGLSVGEFCSREGLTTHSFYSWRGENVDQAHQKIALLPAGLALRACMLKSS